MKISLRNSAYEEIKNGIQKSWNNFEKCKELVGTVVNCFNAQTFKLV